MTWINTISTLVLWLSGGSDPKLNQSTEQFWVIFQDLFIGQLTTQLFAPYTSKLMRHTPSGEHPYLAVRLRDSLTRRYGRRSLMSCQRTICHKEESNLNFVPAIRTTHTGYGLTCLEKSLAPGCFFNFLFFYFLFVFFIFLFFMFCLDIYSL